MKLVLNIAIALLLLTVCKVFANEQTQYSKNIDHLAMAAKKYLNFNGSILVAKSGSIIYQKSFGYADKDEKITLSTQHRLSSGSIGKEFTTAAIMILKDKNRVHYEDKLSKYLPELPLWASEITIEHILTHTSGLPKIKWKLNITTADVMEQVKAIDKPAFIPGDGYLYGNINVVLRALVVEKITNQPFETFVKNNIFTPSGMTSTFNKTKSTENRSLMVAGDYPTAISGVSIYTIPLDLYKWEKALWGGKLISKAALDKVIIEHELSGNSKRAYFDFGTFNRNKGKLIEVEHDGSHPSHHAIKFNNLEDDLIIILMSSDGNKSTLYDLKQYILNVKDHESSKIPAAWWLTHSINSNGLEKALQNYKKLVKRSNNLNTDETQLNRIGYWLNGNEQLDEAIKVMKLNLEYFPDSANAHDSYAELLIKAGKYSEAKPIVKRGIRLAKSSDNKYLQDVLSRSLKNIQENNK